MIQKGISWADSLSAIEWIDWTAIVLLSVFFLLGLFKGFVWQVTRILTLVGAWFLAGRFGPDGEIVLDEWVGAGTSDEHLHLFVSYVVIFIASVVVFSLVAWLLHKLVRESGLTLYDRLGGAVLGLGTGSLVVVVILAMLYMFVPSDKSLVRAAERSQSMEYSQRALRLLGKRVPEAMRHAFRLGDGAGGAAGQATPGKKDSAGEAKVPDAKAPDGGPAKQPADAPPGKGK